MARVFTKGPQGSGDIVLSQPQNEEINQSAAELNGGLDQNNMPLISVSRAKMVVPVTTTVASPNQTSIVYQSQAYYFTEESANQTIITKDSWSVGWNKFEVLASAADIDGFFLDFQSVEGMLKGETCLDLSMRQSYKLIRSGGVDYSRITDNHEGEIGVFVNDVLVARTGPIWLSCGRHSYVLPYACAIGSGPCHVDVRWRIEFKNEYYPTFPTTGTNEMELVASLKINNRLTWCRNEFR